MPHAPLLGFRLSATSAEELQRALGQTFDGDAYQVERPTVLPAELPEIGPPPDLGWAGPLLEALMWAGIVVAAILLGVALLRALSERASEGAEPEPASEDPTAHPGEALPLADASTLAAQGRYDEAIHALLLRTLEVLSEQERLPDSWTSREVVSRLALGAGPRASLERLVDATEISLFGGRPAGPDEFATCVEHWQRFREARA